MAPEKISSNFFLFEGVDYTKKVTVVSFLNIIKALFLY